MLLSGQKISFASKILRNDEGKRIRICSEILGCDFPMPIALVELKAEYRDPDQETKYLVAKISGPLGFQLTYFADLDPRIEPRSALECFASRYLSDAAEF